MADVYLTKVERKTIFTQGLIYVVIMLIISDLTVTGPYIVCTIPWLFFMGIISISKFNHHLLTLLITTITVFMASFVAHGGLNIEVWINTLTAAILTTTGIICGSCIKNFVLRHRMVKYMTPMQVTINVCLMVIATVITILATTYADGNIAMYLVSRNKLDKYIQNTYNMDYTIEDTLYVRGFNNIYEYHVEMGKYTVDFLYDMDEKDFKDNNYTNRHENMIEALNDNLIHYKQKGELNGIFEYEINAVYAYGTQTVVPEGINIEVILDSDKLKERTVTDNSYQLMVDEINYLYKYIDEYDINVKRVIITVGNSAAVVKREVLKDLDVDYLKKGFHVVETEQYMGTIEAN